jgi:hypothetical protein
MQNVVIYEVSKPLKNFQNRLDIMKQIFRVER